MRSLLFAVVLAAASVPVAAQTDADLLTAARSFPAMPQGNADLARLLGRLPTFSSGAPFNDLEFTAFDTDYIDGENGGFDVFLPVDPSDPSPGSDRIQYVRTVQNLDLDARYGAARGDRIILGTAEIPAPFFLRGADGVDNDYAVVQHFDYSHGFIQLRGSASDYRLLFATEADGVASEGSYLFHVAGGAPDLVAFVFPCDTIALPISGNPPQTPRALCNASGTLSLSDPAQFRFAEPLPTAVALPAGLAQVGTDGKEVVSGVTADADGNVYLFGLSDGDLDGSDGAANQLFVAKVTPGGARAWTTAIPITEGSIFKDATADDEHLYAVGRTLGALPGFQSAGSWDGIIVKLRLADGAVVATDQYGTSGIDGYGNAVLDDAGGLYVSAQGARPGTSGTDRDYLVAKHDAATLANVWRVIEPPAGQVLASAEAWGGLTYQPGAAPGDGRLVAGGWYFAAGGADAFVAVYDRLSEPTPCRAAFRAIATGGGPTADWVLDNGVGPDGSVYVVGYTTGALDGVHRGDGDAYVMKLSPSLDVVAVRQFGTARTDLARKVEVGADGSLYVVGYTYGSLYGPNADPSGTSGDVFAVKLDADLAVLASVQFGTAGEDRAGASLRNGRLYVGGMTEAALAGPSAGSFDGWAAVLDPADLSVGGAVAAEPGATALDALAVFPNPASGPATVELTTAGPGPVRVSVVDVLGREQAVLWDGPLGTDRHRFAVETGALAPGVYVVRVEAERGRLSRALTVVR